MMNKQQLMVLTLCGVATIAYAQPRAGLQQLSTSFFLGRASESRTVGLTGESELDRPSVSFGLSYSRFTSERWVWSAGLSFSGSTTTDDADATQPTARFSEDRHRFYTIYGSLSRFYKLSDRWYASVNAGLGLNYNRIRGEQVDKSTGDLLRESEQDRYSVDLFAGASLWYFFHPRWALGTGLSLAGVRYGWSSVEQRDGSTQQFLSGSSGSSWNANLLPAASVGSWSFSVSYQF